MSEAIVVALITGSVSLIGAILSNLASARKAEASIWTRQAVTDTKLEELAREVRMHNRFAERIPVVEEQITAIHHRIGNLEKMKGVYHYEKLENLAESRRNPGN